jgi:hypothetical protein
MQNAVSVSQQTNDEVEHNSNKKSEEHTKLLDVQHAKADSLRSILDKLSEQSLHMRQQTQNAQNNATESVMKNTESLMMELEKKVDYIREPLDELVNGKGGRADKYDIRQDTVEKINDHVRSVQARIKFICGQIKQHG